jgi:hypothetical protein
MYLRALRFLGAIALRRGFGGSRPWMVVGMAVVGLRALRRLARDEPEVLYRTQVRAGDRLLVTASRPE